jgi:hypothetical protein
LEPLALQLNNPFLVNQQAGHSLVLLLLKVLQEDKEVYSVSQLKLSQEHYLVVHSNQPHKQVEVYLEQSHLLQPSPQVFLSLGKHNLNLLLSLVVSNNLKQVSSDKPNSLQVGHYLVFLVSQHPPPQMQLNNQYR